MNKMPSEQAPRPPSVALNRRAVLGAAVAGGIGVAAARALGIRRTVEVDPEQLTASAVASRSGLDWVSPLQDEASRVAHLLRRTTFGASAMELERAVADGYARTVDRLIETPPAEPPPLAGAEESSQKKGLNLNALQTWWVDWMLRSPTPFAEKMTLFWHGHFTSEYRKVGLQSPFMYWQNLTWRRAFLGDLRTILYDVTVDPAMLRYLDLAQSTGRNPNENYARELMELYTMGSGTFSEDDVKAGSRALAGWREPRTEAMVAAQIEESIKRTGAAPKTPPIADKMKVGIFDQRRAFVGGVSFLRQTRQWDTRSVIDRILEQDTVAPFIARKVVQRFVTPQGDEAMVARLATRFRASRYDMRTLMHDLFTSPEFVAPASYRALVKSPIEFMVGAARALEAPQLSKIIVGAGATMGQVPFDPPSVGGWPENDSWISSNNMLGRINFVTQALGQARKLPRSDDAHAQQLDAVLSAQTLRLLNETNDERKRWAVLLCCPEFQLK